MDELVAQLVEQYTFNVWAQGSSPCQFTKNSYKFGSFFMPWLLFISYTQKK